MIKSGQYIRIVQSYKQDGKAKHRTFFLSTRKNAKGPKIGQENQPSKPFSHYPKILGQTKKSIKMEVLVFENRKNAPELSKSRISYLLNISLGRIVCLQKKNEFTNAHQKDKKIHR